MLQSIADPSDWLLSSAAVTVIDETTARTATSSFGGLLTVSILEDIATTSTGWQHEPITGRDGLSGATLADVTLTIAADIQARTSVLVADIVEASVMEGTNGMSPASIGAGHTGAMPQPYSGVLDVVFTDAVPALDVADGGAASEVQVCVFPLEEFFDSQGSQSPTPAADVRDATSPLEGAGDGSSVLEPVICVFPFGPDTPQV